MRCVMAIDAGTGSERCLIFDETGRSVGRAAIETPTLYPRPGYAEQVPQQIVDHALDAARRAMADGDVRPEDVVGVCFTGMQSSFAPIDRRGRFLGNLILWQDMRGAEVFGEMLERLAEQGIDEAGLYRVTGHPLDTVVMAPKLAWLRAHTPEVMETAWKLVTPQAILARAFGGEWCDCAGDTGLWMTQDCDRLENDARLLTAFGIDPGLLPATLPSGARVGEVSGKLAERTGLRRGTPLFIGAGDQPCAALGAGNYGTSKIVSLCLGTAGVAMACANAPLRDPNQTWHILGYPGGGFALEAATPVAASALRWLRDVLIPGDKRNRAGLYDAMTTAAQDADLGASGLIFVPHLAGMACPTRDASMRGAFVGLSLDTGRGEMIRAVMEGVCFAMRAMLEAYRAAGAEHFETLRVLGGATRSPFWNQMQADVYGCPVETIEETEASALGAAMIAACGAGIYGSLREACAGMTRVSNRYEPNPANVRRYDDLYEVYQASCRDLAREAFGKLAVLRG